MHQSKIVVWFTIIRFCVESIQKFKDIFRLDQCLRETGCFITRKLINFLKKFYVKAFPLIGLRKSISYTTFFNVYLTCMYNFFLLFQHSVYFEVFFKIMLEHIQTLEIYVLLHVGLCLKH